MIMFPSRNWSDLLPPTTARKQASWEKRHAVRCAYQSGAKISAMAERLGLTYCAVRDNILKAEQEVKKGVMSPVEKFLDGNFSDEVEDFCKKSSRKRKSKITDEMVIAATKLVPATLHGLNGDLVRKMLEAALLNKKKAA